jgi:hypothetical protein
MESDKQPYSPPLLTALTREQAIKLVAKRKNCSEEEAAKLLDSLRKQPAQGATDHRKPKRSA